MTDVTKEMLVEYMRRKGGRVKNVDLVKHFRKYLLFEDPKRKGEWLALGGLAGRVRNSDQPAAFLYTCPRTLESVRF